MRLISLCVVTSTFILGLACSGSGDTSTVPDVGAMPSPSEARDEAPERRPSLGRSALRGIVMVEDGLPVLATCAGERVVLFDDEDAPYAWEGPDAAMATFDVERVAISAIEIQRGLDGAARVGDVVETQPFSAGDCGLVSATTTVPTVEPVAVTIAEENRRALRLGAVLPASWPEAAEPFIGDELVLLELAAATNAICDVKAGVHRTFWEVERSDGSFVGAWFMPCVIAARVAARAESGASRTWTFTDAAGGANAVEGSTLAPRSAVQLLGVRGAFALMKVQCGHDGRCPSGMEAETPGQAARQAMQVGDGSP